MVRVLPRSGPRPAAYGCDNGIWRGCECQTDKKLFEGTPGTAYYTTWSMILIITAFVATILVFFFGNNINSLAQAVLGRTTPLQPSSRVKWLGWQLLYIILVSAAANSMAVLASAQFMYASFQNPWEDEEVGECPFTMDIDMFRSVNVSNIMGHVLPVAFTFIVIAVLVKSIRRPIENKFVLFFGSFLFIYMFSMIYMAVPLKTEDGKQLTWLDKFEQVYYNDNAGMVASVPVTFVFFLAVIIWMDK